MNTCWLDLGRSKFGQPGPRHGLQLLYWFARDYIKFDNNNGIVMRYNPENGNFGFHRFENRIDQGARLLPYQNSPYYEVGNLHSVKDLPTYVTEKYTGEIDDSNTDRLIIGLNSKRKLSKVYVTQHEDERNFAHDRTYEISTDLVREIHKFTKCKTFLKRVMKKSNNTYRGPKRKDGYAAVSSSESEDGLEQNDLPFSSGPSRQEEDRCCCTIL